MESKMELILAVCVVALFIDRWNQDRDRRQHHRLARRLSALVEHDRRKQ